MNPSRSIARPFNECMPCLLMLRLVMLTLVAIITSTTMALTGQPSRDPNSSGLAIPMAFVSTERPSTAEPAETISACGSVQPGSTAPRSNDSRLTSAAGDSDFSSGPGALARTPRFGLSVLDTNPFSVSLSKSEWAYLEAQRSSPCPATPTANGQVESTGFDQRLPLLLTPREIPR